MDFITTNNLILIPVIMGIGFALKSSKKISDNYIPFILIALGAILGLLNAYSFDGAMQGILCASVAMGIYDTSHMIYRGKKKDGR